jgi:hypothetical protein
LQTSISMFCFCELFIGFFIGNILGVRNYYEQLVRSFFREVNEQM